MTTKCANLQCSALAGGNEARHGQGPDSQRLRSAMIYSTSLPLGCIIPPTPRGAVFGYARVSMCADFSAVPSSVATKHSPMPAPAAEGPARSRPEGTPPLRSFSPFPSPRALKQPSSFHCAGSFHYSIFLQTAPSPTKLRPLHPARSLEMMTDAGRRLVLHLPARMSYLHPQADAPRRERAFPEVRRGSCSPCPR